MCKRVDCWKVLVRSESLSESCLELRRLPDDKRDGMVDGGRRAERAIRSNDAGVGRGYQLPIWNSRSVTLFLAPYSH